VNNYAGGFDLEVFRKDPSIDPTCAPDYIGERNRWLSDPNELPIVVGQWEGPNTSFSLSISSVMPKAGPVLLCAYSDWSTDTAAAAAPLTINVAPAVSKPVNTVKPRVSRSGKRLSCSSGTWTNSPTGFTYGWMVNGRLKSGAHGRRLGVSHSVKGRRVRCVVTASNAAGAATAFSRSYRVV
jgi:hypothetical protein